MAYILPAPEDLPETVPASEDPPTTATVTDATPTNNDAQAFISVIRTY